MIGIILLIFFLIGVLADLTSFSPFDTATSYIEEAKKKGINDIKSFFGKFSQLFDNTEWIEADESEYDPDNEFDIGYMTTYNLINTMLNKAYSKEVDDLVDRYCNENGLNSALTKQKLDEKYPNKWKDVYETVNYAELINILGLGKYSGKYTDYESMKIVSF